MEEIHGSISKSLDLNNKKNIQTLEHLIFKLKSSVQSMPSFQIISPCSPFENGATQQSDSCAVEPVQWMSGAAVSIDLF